MNRSLIYLVSFFKLFYFQSFINCTFYYTDHLKTQFEKTFHDKCDKYSFVQQWIKLLENPPMKHHLIFLYQQGGLKNGGLGDRMAGVISAVSIALRYGRPLLLYSETSGLEKLFRPYHPFDLKRKEPLYTWENNAHRNWTSWSNYEGHYCCNDNTEYDLWWCINNLGNKNRQCGMYDGDASQPHILYRSNRAYLCGIHNSGGSRAHNDMLNVLGVSDEDDLFEVGGCMLRLAMWPTDYLWSEVDKIYQAFDKSVKESHSSQHNAHPHRRKLQQEESHHHGWHSIHYPNIYFQVGLHFRCGDKSYTMRGGFDNNCVFDPNNHDQNYLKTFVNGNPMSIAECGNHVFQEYANEVENITNPVIANSTDVLPDRHHNKHLLLNTMLFVSSDNTKASEQMNRTVGHPYSYFAPQGCHIELDASFECHLFTVSNWFVLALSDRIITQTLLTNESPKPGPTSAYSRYAGVYGLKNNPFRNNRDCGVVTTTKELGFAQMGNWYC